MLIDATGQQLSEVGALLLRECPFLVHKDWGISESGSKQINTSQEKKTKWVTQRSHCGQVKKNMAKHSGMDSLYTPFTFLCRGNSSEDN